jgi:hypothetical protein
VREPVAGQIVHVGIVAGELQTKPVDSRYWREPIRGVDEPESLGEDLPGIIAMDVQGQLARKSEHPAHAED